MKVKMCIPQLLCCKNRNNTTVTTVKITVLYLSQLSWKPSCCVPILKWDIDEISPSKLVNFLYMTLSINFNRIISKTQQKMMNRHLYVPPASKHSPCNTKGIIFSLVQRYFNQNTFLTDFVYFVGLLYQRLILR